MKQQIEETMRSNPGAYYGSKEMQSAYMKVVDLIESADRRKPLFRTYLVDQGVYTDDPLAEEEKAGD